MARRRATKRASKHAARKSIHAPKFSADHLPVELIHMVFTYLEPTEAALFRWAGRVVAEIGLQYLAPTVYLKLNEESYDRLLAIAEHPVVSKYVVKLEYETTGLQSINREEFDREIRSIMKIPQRHEFEPPGPLTSARARRSYVRQSVRDIPLLGHRQIGRLLKQTWSMYKTCRADQKKVEQANFFREKTVEAIKQFQNLKSISTSTYGVYERYLAGVKELLPTCYSAHSAFTIAPIVDASSPILMAAESAGLYVENFCCQPCSWQFFTLNKRDLAASKRSMLHLKTMSIAFASPPGTSTFRAIQSAHRAHRGILAKGHVRNLISSAPDLEYLGVTTSVIYAKIDGTIGKSYWSSLKAVSLKGLMSEGNDLVDFCKRHAHTLKDLSLAGMRLNEGSWYVTFHRIRRAFRLGQQLDTCKLGEYFISPEDRYHMGDHDANATGMIASDYILATDVGDISLNEYQEARGFQ
ncbi:MAG: hypothetical protein Q9161_003418 [Pseudevernia consocians]